MWQRTTIPITEAQEQKVLDLLRAGKTPPQIAKGEMAGTGIGVGRILSVMQRHRLQRKDAAWSGLAEGSGEAAGGTRRVRVFSKEERQAYALELMRKGRKEFLPKVTEEELAAKRAKARKKQR